MQKGMEIDKKSPDCRNFLRVLMGLLEQMKDQLKNNEAIQSELVGQAHIEDAAIKLFFFADTEDRSSRFDKNVVKAFYTSSMLFDVLNTFGPLSEELEKSKKYAKWKAAYIHNCLKNGTAPSPGPLAEASEELGISADYQFQKPRDCPQTITPRNSPNQTPPNQPEDFNQPPENSYYMNQSINKVLPNNPSNFMSSAQPPVNLSENPHPRSSPNPPFGGHPQPAPRQNNFEPIPQTNNAGPFKLRSEDFAKAMKYCKFANSALQYEDAPAAISNLSKALKLLTTGCE